MTKTYKYLFIPFMKLYYGTKEVNNKYYTTNVYNALMKLDIIDVYLSEGTRPVEEGTFFVLVNMKDKDNFNTRLETIKQSNLYESHYLVGTNDSPMCMILIKSHGGKMIKKFLESKYSEIFDRNLLKDERLSKLFINHTTNDYDDTYKVLIKDEDLANMFALSMDTDIENINELESKIKLEEEIYNGSGTTLQSK